MRRPLAPDFGKAATGGLAPGVGAPGCVDAIRAEVKIFDAERGGYGGPAYRDAVPCFSLRPLRGDLSVAVSFHTATGVGLHGALGDCRHVVGLLHVAVVGHEPTFATCFCFL